jgi:hypothetical protein
VPELAIEIALRTGAEAAMPRWDRICEILVTKGGFTVIEASRAIHSPSPEDKEPVARYLRRELRKLRKAESSHQPAPVRLGKLLSRSEISTIAFEMLESCESTPGAELLDLIGELLGVERDVEQADDEAAKQDIAAEIEGQLRAKGYTISSRRLAKLVDVHYVTVTRWRKLPEFQKKVEAAAESPDERRARIAALRNRTK